MTKRFPLIVIGTALVALAVLAGWRIWSQRAVPGRLELAGDVASDVRAVRAPAIVYPVVDHTVGIGAAASGPGPGQAVRTPPDAAGRMPRVSGRLASVLVVEGDRVTTGQVVARLDTAMLELGVDQARTAAVKAHADVEVLGGALGEIADNEAELADARSELASARAKLKKTRSDLLVQIAQVEAMLKAPRPPGAPKPPPSQDPAVVLAKLKAALAQVDAGLAKTASARSKLNEGADRLADARSQVTGAREVLGIVAGAKDIAVDLAEARLAQAAIVAPVTGVVTEARRAGTLAMVGAPVVRIRPAAPTRLDTFVTPEQLGRVRVGSPAEVDFDSNPGGPLPGRVTRIAETAEFPPNAFPTGVVHMTRAVRVTITLDGGGWAPPGTPADVTILTD